jgi:hypothetical protein
MGQGQTNYEVAEDVNLCAKFYFQKKQFNWEFDDPQDGLFNSNNNSKRHLKLRIRLEFGDVQSINFYLTIPECGSKSRVPSQAEGDDLNEFVMEIETTQVSLFKETNPQPKQNKQWIPSTYDFTSIFISNPTFKFKK